MELDRFEQDLEALPGSLRALAARAQRGRLWVHGPDPARILLTGMGSSHYAAATIARRLRGKGLTAVAEVASAESIWLGAADLLVVAISATGRSAETLRAVEPHVGISDVVVVTNDTSSPLAQFADEVVDLGAGDERSGVTARSFHDTLAVLLALEAALTGGVRVAEVLRRAAEASADLLDRRQEWLPAVDEALADGTGTWFLAPAERWCSAEQSALMVREVPRRLADACETGDWSHVDVYLTKTYDYRAVVFTGSHWEAAAADWMGQRNSTVVAVGGTFPGAVTEVRYRRDDDPLVALLVEALVVELLADRWHRDRPV